MLNPFDEAVRLDPYPVYAQMRADVPAQRVPLPGGRGLWLVTRYADVERALRHPALGKNVRRALAAEDLPPLPDAARPLVEHMLSQDPPDHTRLRALVSQAFTPRLIEGRRDRIQAIADDLLDAVAPRGAMDLLDDYAFPLPIRVITNLLGVPEEDADRFRAWSAAVVSIELATLGLGIAADKVTAMGEFRDYLLALFDRKRRAPGDDLVTGLVRAEDERGALTEDELVAMVFLLLVAGHETTVNLIGNGVLALLRHPDQLALVRDDPALIQPAVEELLRYDGPVETSTMRYALEDLELAGAAIAKGDAVLVVLASANRDGAQFPDPDRLDVTRPDNRHLAFGKGLHYCLGAPLARMEATIALATLLRRLPGLRLAADPATLSIRPSFLIRGLHALPVAW